MKTKIDPDELNLIKLAQDYSDEDKARSLFESWRWPNGPVCPHCKHNEFYKIESKPGTKNKVRPGLYCCAACRKPFTATVGTVLEDSHIPISKWVMAMFILCSAKKSVSANQLHRMLGVTYKTAWFMAHRLRFAMGTDLKTAKPLTGTVEADETFVGGKGDFRTMHKRKTTLAAIVERGGEVRTKVIASVTAKNVGKFLHECVSKEAIVNTDEHGAYRIPAKQYKRHDTVIHSRKEYSRDLPDGSTAGINHAESFFSLLKRGVFGSWHSVSREHLPKYANEFEFRWNNRKVTDGQRTVNLMPMIEGKRLMYRQPVN
jgi:transposase-like protein